MANLMMFEYSQGLFGQFQKIDSNWSLIDIVNRFS